MGFGWVDFLKYRNEINEEKWLRKGILKEFEGGNELEPL